MRKMNIILILVMCVVVTVRVFGSETEVQPDSPRYLQMGLNMAEHGVLTADPYVPGVPPEPGLGLGGPFTAFEIALAAILSGETKKSFECVVAADDYRQCKMNVPALKSFYVVELILFHLAVWLIARHVFQSDGRAWLAAFVSLAFKDTGIYAHSILTEPAYMMAAGVFFTLWLYALIREQDLKVWFLCGLALGSVTMVKPAWSALMPGLLVLGALFALWRGSDFKVLARNGAFFAAGVATVSSVLLIRNVVQLDFWGLSDPAYMAASFAHRFAFNAMSWTEWFAGWIYYLPDFGDNLARSLFGADTVSRLGWGTESYYVYGRDVLHGQAAQIAAQTPGQNTGAYLLENHFLNDIAKSLGVTAVLAWRGIFIGGWFGLASVLLAAPVLALTNSRARRLMLLIALPAVLMAGIHALVSVSMTRYNLPLVIPYALILAQALYAIGAGVSRLAPSGLLARAKTFLPKNG